MIIETVQWYPRLTTVQATSTFLSRLKDLQQEAGTSTLLLSQVAAGDGPTLTMVHQHVDRAAYQRSRTFRNGEVAVEADTAQFLELCRRHPTTMLLQSAEPIAPADLTSGYLHAVWFSPSPGKSGEVSSILRGIKEGRRAEGRPSFSSGGRILSPVGNVHYFADIFDDMEDWGARVQDLVRNHGEEIVRADSLCRTTHVPELHEFIGA